MNTIATPRARRSSRRSSSRCVAASESELVASSSTITRESADTARATSTSCCISIESVPTRAREST